jgi:hypothetical protein
LLGRLRRWLRRRWRRRRRRPSPELGFRREGASVKREGENKAVCLCRLGPRRQEGRSGGHAHYLGRHITGVFLRLKWMRAKAFGQRYLFGSSHWADSFIRSDVFKTRIIRLDRPDGDILKQRDICELARARRYRHGAMGRVRRRERQPNPYGDRSSGGSTGRQPIPVGGAAHATPGAGEPASDTSENSLRSGTELGASWCGEAGERDGGEVTHWRSSDGGADRVYGRQGLRGSSFPEV